MSPTDGRDELRGRFTRWIVITAKNAQRNYLRAEKKQLQTVPLINRLSSYAGNLDEDCRQYIMLHILLHISEFRI